MGSRRAAAAFTDPPYNVRIDGHATGNGAIRHREFAMASSEMSEAESHAASVAFPAWLLGHDPTAQIICASYGQDLADTQAAPTANSLTILKAIARARAWREKIIAGDATGIRDLARLHSLSHSYVKRIYRLAALSPASIEAILNREVPPGLSLDSLDRRIPLDWKEQSALFTGATKI